MRGPCPRRLRDGRRGRAEFETGISDGDDWETQLTKAFRLIEVIETLQAEGGYDTAVIEVSFGAIERSIEAYALAMTNDSLQDFQGNRATGLDYLRTLYE